jgi:oxygen-independent coproporphyrinogen III oxidase
MSLTTEAYNELIKKYNVAGPRYTSYPTVPLWETEHFTISAWEASIQKQFSLSQEISIYIHLPYCESLCTYCGCNTRITVNHAVERPYIEAVLKEWKMYLALFDTKPILKELHLGGGTPTFFSAENLSYLLTGIYEHCIIPEDHSFGFEGHPANTTKEHLDILASLGFDRVSFGIQDFDPYIQDVINRKQTVEQVAAVTEWARAAGYTSINYDLIYGLPFQTVESIKKTISTVCELKPDRIAFYSYAHVPWLKPSQRKYSDKDLPNNDVKRSLYETGKQLFLAAGFQEIGMDHFALAGDELFEAFENKSLHRNFMGYTVSETNLLIGLGVSSISDSSFAFAQNHKTVEAYQLAIAENMLPSFRGHMTSDEDFIFRKHILALMCNLESTYTAEEAANVEFQTALNRLKDLIADKLVTVESNKITVTELGKAFVRNICMAFDVRLHSVESKSNRFSSVI